MPTQTELDFEAAAATARDPFPNTGAPLLQGGRTLVQSEWYPEQAMPGARSPASWCTQTKWAVALMLFAAVCAAGVGIGVYLAMRGTDNADVPGSPASPVTPVTPVTPVEPTEEPKDLQLEALLKIKTFVDTTGTALEDWDRERGADGAYCTLPWTGVQCTGSDVTWLNLWPFSDGTGVKGLKGSVPPAAAFEGLPGLEKVAIGDQPGIAGSLPADWSSLQLEDIRLVNNSLTGSLPALWGSMAKLKVLYLFNNNITGHIPDSFESLTSLNELKLQHNVLFGTLPAWLDSMQRLNLLQLHGNLFNGAIPEKLGNTTMMRHMSMGNNFLFGTIPASLSRMSGLQELLLTNNMLNGMLPESFKALTSLEVLALGGNALSGTVPASWSNMTGLKEVYLWGNSRLSGCVPASWKSQLAGFNTTLQVFSGTNITGFC